MNGIVLNDSILGVKEEVRKRQRYLYNLNHLPDRDIQKVRVTCEIAKLKIIEQELRLIQTMKIYSI